jgi:hypothetical protein
MSDQTFTQPPRGPTGVRIASFALSAFLGLVAFGLVAAGGVLLWGDSHKDRDGFIASGSDRFHSDGFAVASEDLDVDLDGAGWALDEGSFGKVRLQASSRTGKSVFVGIAPTRDVESYLRRSAHSSVADLDYSPFRVRYREHAGDSRPVPPAQEDFWAASAQGAGTQSMTWKVRDGSWSVVVMNADGSRGVDAGVSAGAAVPFLRPLGWGLLGGGLVLLAGAGALVIVGVRAGRRPTAPEPARILVG